MRDKLTGGIIGETTCTNPQSPSDPLLAGEADASALTDIQGIETLFRNLIAVFMNKGTSITPDDVDPFLATDYGMENGRNRAEQLVYEADDPLETVATLRSIAMIGKRGDDYEVNVVWNMPDMGSIWQERWYFVTKEGPDWKLKGNGFLARITEERSGAITQKIINTDESVTTQSLIQFEIWDNTGQGVERVVVTGPGLGSVKYFV